jgi:transcriptional regulator with XRE-family HTH domain
MTAARMPPPKKQRRERHAADGGSTTYMSVVEDVTRAGITQAELARAVGAGIRTVQNWASGRNAPRGQAAKRLLDVRTAITMLGDSYTDEGVDIWLHSRNRNLDMQRPIDLIVDGEIDKVIDEAAWVAGGM